MSAKDEGDYRCTVTRDENFAFANVYVRIVEDSTSIVITGAIAAFFFILAIIAIVFLRRSSQEKRVRNVTIVILYHLVAVVPSSLHSRSVPFLT